MIELVVLAFIMFSIIIIGVIGCVSTLEEIDNQNKIARFEFNEKNRK